MQGGFIETYGDPHLHSGFYPIAKNEKEMHRCDEGMYCDNFPDDYRVGPIQTPHEGPVVIRHSSNPAVRYGYADDQSGKNYEVGTGCMNLDCMAPNCHGQIRCPHCKADLKEGFGIGCGCSLSDGTLFYLVLALALFALWYFYLRKQ